MRLRSFATAAVLAMAATTLWAAQPGLTQQDSTQHQHSPYAGHETSEIPSLTPDELAQLQNGDGMGFAKAALESANRYLARELGPQGIRCNLVAAGPIKTMAAKSIPGFKQFEDVWDDRAPLGWDVTDSEPVARACIALLSDWFPATTGEIVHVDGGYHAMGA